MRLRADNLTTTAHAQDCPRVEQRAFFESQAAIKFHGPRIVRANGQKWPLAAGANTLDQRSHDGSRVTAAFMARRRGHCSYFPIPGEMQSQPAHCNQLAVFANPQELSQLLNARAQRAARTRGCVDGAHFGHIGGRELNDFRCGAVLYRGQRHFGFLHHLVQFNGSNNIPARWYLRRRGEVEH